MLMQIIIAGELAFIAVVLATNSWAVRINVAAHLLVQVAAPALELDIPIAVLDKDAHLPMGEVPANIIKITGRLRRIDWQRNVLTALPAATKTGVGVNVLTCHHSPALRLSHQQSLSSDTATSIWIIRCEATVSRRVYAQAMKKHGKHPDNVYNTTSRPFGKSPMAEDITVMELKTRARSIVRLLKKHYPHATTALRWENPLQLLVATILSAQCTDTRVNEVTRELFEGYSTAEQFAQANLSELEQQVRSTGFFRQKAKSIKSACALIVKHFGGQVPGTMAELITLPGVARKTANVVLGTAFGRPEGIAVDTHVGRVSVRLELAPSAKGPKDAVRIENDLMRIVPRNDWISFSHALILHGRQICQARKPKCTECMLLSLCPFGRRMTRI